MLSSCLFSIQVFSSGINNYPFLTKYNHTINVYLGSSSDYPISAGFAFAQDLVANPKNYVVVSQFHTSYDLGISDFYFDKVGRYSLILVVLPVSALNSTSALALSSTDSNYSFLIEHLPPFNYLTINFQTIPTGDGEFYSTVKPLLLGHSSKTFTGGCVFSNGFNDMYRNHLQDYSTDNLTIKFHLGSYEPSPPPVSSEPPPPVSSRPIVPPYVPPNFDMVVFPPDAMEHLKDKVTGVINSATVVGMLAFGLLLIIPIMVKIIKHYTTRGGGVGG